MIDLMNRLYPICRSITGNGVRETLKILQEFIPLKVHEVPSGTQVFDWNVPLEWNIRDAYVADNHGNRIIDFKKNNLHLVGYSTPIDTTMRLKELQNHLHSIENQPTAIPYVTSYYKEYWGFCISHEQRLALKDDTYHVYIDSELKEGHLTYGELLIPGKSEKEIFLSTYICHPSMANNELSGPVVMTHLVQWIMKQPRNYSYRIVFIPETIGSITYLSKNIVHMKKNILAGFNITCVGDDNTYSFLPSRYGNTIADKVSRTVLENKHPGFIEYSFLERGSDERQYCSPGIDLPVVSLMRTKYGEYKEYHTSLDNMDFVSEAGLKGSLELLKDCIMMLENNKTYKATYLCEPQLGKRGLYPTISKKGTSSSVKTMMNFLAYSDGQNDLIEMSSLIKVKPEELLEIAQKLESEGLIKSINP